MRASKNVFLVKRSELPGAPEPNTVWYCEDSDGIIVVTYKHYEMQNSYTVFWCGWLLMNCIYLGKL